MKNESPLQTAMKYCLPWNLFLKHWGEKLYINVTEVKLRWVNEYASVGYGGTWGFS